MQKRWREESHACLPYDESVLKRRMCAITVSSTTLAHSAKSWQSSKRTRKKETQRTSFQFTVWSHTKPLARTLRNTVPSFLPNTPEWQTAAKHLKALAIQLKWRISKLSQWHNSIPLKRLPFIKTIASTYHPCWDGLSFRHCSVPTTSWCLAKNTWHSRVLSY